MILYIKHKTNRGAVTMIIAKMLSYFLLIALSVPVLSQEREDQVVQEPMSFSLEEIQQIDQLGGIMTTTWQEKRKEKLQESLEVIDPYDV